MAVLIASDLAKDVAGAPLLRGVSLKLERKTRLAVAGRNGAGKTTLLRMLAGELAPDGGELVLEKGARVALHDQRPPRASNLSLRDYILTGCRELVALESELERLEHAMAAGDQSPAVFDAYSRAQTRLEHAGGYDWRERALSTVRGLGFDPEADLDRHLATFSGGELTRASLARVLAADPDLLLLDEPTNHLDIDSLEWLEQTLIGLDAAVVLVAHDRWFLEAVGTAVLELEGGRARFFSGTWHAWRKERAARELAQGRAIERQEAEVARLERFVSRFRAGTRARQAQSRAKKLTKLERQRIARDPRDGRALQFQFNKPERSGRVVFELEQGRIAVGEGAAERTLIDPAELWLERGEHVSLVGSNGSGKTTLIDVLTGTRPPAAGRLRRGHNVTLGYLPQAEEADALEELGARTVLEATQKKTGLTPNRARALLGRFLFSGEEAEKPLEALSGGERRRLSLAVLVASGANVLVLDEPTNHLDLESREALEDALRAFEGSLLLVSHDRALLDAVGSRTVAVEDGALRTYPGGWAEYLSAREERREERKAGAGAPEDGRPSREPGRPGRGTRNRRSSTDRGTSAERRPPADRGSTAKRGSTADRESTADRGSNGERRPNGDGRMSKNAQKRAAELERRIAAAEASLAAVEDELADPAAWADPERAAQSAARHDEARQAVEDLYHRLEAALG